MTNLLYGIHDREGRHFVPPGGWCLDTVALSERPQPADYGALRPDINWIVRLNHAYGSGGTIPLPDRYQDFANSCASYVRHSRGARRWIIANEPNHEQERPNGVFITPAQYARCFTLCREAIKRADADAQVIPAPCAPYHAGGPQGAIPWTDYWREMLELIAANGGCDGIAIHAYTRSSDPADINNDVRMGPPLEGTCAGFLTYQDALEEVPASLRHLPAYLTEFNELLDNGWHDANTGVVQEAYRHIDWWNNHAADADEPKFQCLILYRWPKFDKWHIEGKQGVIDDFRAAVALGYQSPQIHAQKQSDPVKTHLPIVSTGTSAPAPSLPRDIDPRLIARGVTIQTPPLSPGAQYWRVKSARWYDEQESQGRHHIYVEAQDPTGARQPGVPFLVTWPGDEHGDYTKDGSGFDSGNYPMSPSRNEFSVRINGVVPSETLAGIGMGAETPGGFNAGVHTSTSVVFEWAKVPESQPQPIPQPSQPAPASVPPLAHPIQDPARRVISQRFGDNPQDYARFGMAGHGGIDFAVAVGTVVVAVDAGQVMEAGELPDYGTYIKLRHVWGESVYAHLSELRVTHGEHVGKGEMIAFSGNTGNSTGPHLHLAIRVYPYQRGAPYDGYTDPAPYLINVPPQPSLPTQPSQPADLLPIIKAAASDFGLDWRLLASLIWAESSFDPTAVNRNSGASGLGQIMPATWEEWRARVGAHDIFNPADNIRVTAAYLRFLINYFRGDVRKALAAYNFGVGNVSAGVPIPAETLEFANKVLHGRDLLRAVGA